MEPISYQIIRSDRRTIALQITAEGKLLVRCPRRMSSAHVQAFVQEKENWIRSHLECRRPEQPLLTREELEALADAALQDLPRRTAKFAPLVGVSYGRITIRSQKTRWGSCSSAGNLNYNCLLMLCPPEIRDYVVVHELCHRKQMNHSALFWAEVEKILPDWKTRRAWLRTHGSALIARLP